MILVLNLDLLNIFKNLRLRNNLVFQAINQNKFQYIAVIILGICSNVFEFLFLVDLTQFIDNLFFTNENILNSSIIKIFIIIAWSFSSIFFRYFNFLITANIAKDLSNLIIKSLTLLKLNQFEKLGKNKLLALSTINFELVINSIVTQIPIVINFIFSIFIGICIIYKNIGFNTFYILILLIFLLMVFVNLTKTKLINSVK